MGTYQDERAEEPDGRLVHIYGCAQTVGIFGTVVRAFCELNSTCRADGHDLQDD
jgi:hypothetical protein